MIKLSVLQCSDEEASSSSALSSTGPSSDRSVITSTDTSSE
ncbi:unnamed protein product [Gongylonema pulchrum]|uniref:Uncharacterized protein n=1 Tax=Gongylonema pulchrum TaxID=637853 RepID=A0A3P7RDS2_9BILA|nr:unnamed protein product [Gongylonema pulchrum]